MRLIIEQLFFMYVHMFCIHAYMRWDLPYKLIDTLSSYLIRQEMTMHRGLVVYMTRYPYLYFRYYYKSRIYESITTTVVFNNPGCGILEGMKLWKVVAGWIVISTAIWIPAIIVNWIISTGGSWR